MKKLLFAASEAAPFIKTGRLGNTIWELARILAARGIDIRLVIPIVYFQKKSKNK